MKKAIFFDLDDTLLDNYAAFSRVVKEQAIVSPVSEVEMKRYYQQFRSNSNRRFQKYAEKTVPYFSSTARWTDAFGSDRFTNSELLSLEHLYHTYQSQLVMDDSIVTRLQKLSQLDVVLGIITNGFTNNQLNKIKRLGLTSIINPKNIFVSESVGIAKPNKATFDRVINSLDLHSNPKYYIGDNIDNDIAPLINSEWQTIWINQLNEHSTLPKTQVTSIGSALDLLIKEAT